MLFISIAALCVLLLSAALPWVMNSGAALTLNAIDLAEWTSLYPAVMGEAIPMSTTLLLRLPFVCAAAAIGFGFNRARILRALLVIVMTLGLLPPFEFLGAFDNPNYRQQALIAILTLIIGLMGAAGIGNGFRPAIVTIGSVLGLFAVLIGVSRGLMFMQELRLSPGIGIGAVLAVGAFGVLAVVYGYKQLGQRHSRHPIAHQSNVEPV